MYVYFDPETLHPGHVVIVHDQKYDPLSNGEHFIHAPDSTIPMERMHIIKTDDGHALAEKQDMPISLYAAQIKLGVDAIFSGVPNGAMISVNSKVIGAMDDTGSFELTPTSTGFYAVTFALAGYMDWSGTLEVVSGG